MCCETVNSEGINKLYAELKSFSKVAKAMNICRNTVYRNMMKQLDMGRRMNKDDEKNSFDLNFTIKIKLFSFQTFYSIIVLNLN